MSSNKRLTIFGATGNQGGSVIDAVLANSVLQKKYTLRGVTRNASSAKAQSLVAKGVEMVSATVNDVEALKQVIRGSYGVFGLTNFWDKDVLDKQKEIQQGKNIFEACKAEDVTHFVYSSLPYAEKLSNGKLRHVSHFDSKAIVAEFVEQNKGDMIASYFMPAMYLKSAKDEMRVVDGKLTLHMPFPENSNFDWPFLDPASDSGKYIMGLFEGGSAANSQFVHAVSAWTSIKDLLSAMNKEAGQEVVFKETTVNDFRNAHPEIIAEDVTQTMLLVGHYSYYGPGQVSRQSEHDKWLAKGTHPLGLDGMVKANGSWKFD